MSQAIPLAHFRRWLLVYARYIAEQEAYLTELDAAIGDADHGINMRRGMRAVEQQLAGAALACTDVGGLLRTIAMTLISNVGGAAGPLYGAFFLRAAKDANGDAAVTLAQLAVMLHNGVDGVRQRGKAQLDEKTMVDALHPAAEALERAAAAGSGGAPCPCCGPARRRSRHETHDPVAGRQRPGQLSWRPRHRPSGSGRHQRLSADSGGSRDAQRPGDQRGRNHI